MLITFVNEGQVLPQLPCCAVSCRNGTIVLAVANNPWESVHEAEALAQRCIDAGKVTHREAFAFWKNEDRDGPMEKELPGWE